MEIEIWHISPKNEGKTNRNVLHDELRNNFFAISMPQSCETTTKNLKNNHNYYLHICSWT
jgi:hypothetical protein